MSNSTCFSIYLEIIFFLFMHISRNTSIPPHATFVILKIDKKDYSELDH